MPVDDVVDICVVDDLNADLPVFLETQDRAGDGAVVAIGLDHLSWRQFDRQGGNLDRVVGVRGLRQCRDCPAERKLEGTPVRNSRRPSSMNRSFALAGARRDNARSGAQNDDEPGRRTPHHEHQESNYAYREIGCTAKIALVQTGA